MPFSRRRIIRDCLAALDASDNYVSWQTSAEDLDQLLELDAWRADDDSPHYDAQLIRTHISDMQRMREDENPIALAALIQESLYRHQNDLAEPELYETAWGGTKHLVTRYLNEAAASIEWLATVVHPAVSTALRQGTFTRSAHVYGRSALMLSGGATLGFHHLGVVKALFEADLLPDILSGASMGAMIAAGTCSRTNDELRDLFANPGQIALSGLQWLKPRAAVRDRHLLDPDQLKRTIIHNCGDWTFGEANARSGRTIAISVSPTRRRQKPRVLCHLTTPMVTIASAALASSMVPGLFPAVALEQRDPSGAIQPYAEHERWIDGSLRGDLPMFRVGRLHNVNHFIVSQTNPHVLPFVGNGQQRGFAGWAGHLMARAAHRQGVNVVSLAREMGHRTPLAPALDVAEALAAQRYRGDIDIFPPVDLRDYRKVVANPTRADLEKFIATGERGTWPKLGMIHDQTLIGRTLQKALATLPP
jgi:TAG lipase / steryl ester hydrolase / phospholipase A2 / LPA acyltransferase